MYNHSELSRLGDSYWDGISKSLGKRGESYRERSVASFVLEAATQPLSGVACGVLLEGLGVALSHRFRFHLLQTGTMSNGNVSLMLERWMYVVRIVVRFVALTIDCGQQDSELFKIQRLTIFSRVSRLTDILFELFLTRCRIRCFFTV